MFEENRNIEVNIEALTQREQQVLAMIGRGHSIPQIAEKLFRSQKTIETHRQSLGRKLGVSNRVELARIAIREGLAPLDVGRGAQRSSDDPRQRLSGDASATYAVSDIESACSAVVGVAYCRALVERLPQTLDTAGAAIAFFAEEESQSAHTVALRHRDAWMKNQDMKVVQTPCEETLIHGFFVCQGNVIEQFPMCEGNLPFAIQSYMGVRLDDPMTGEPVGILFTFQDHPIDFEVATETVLRVCAARAGAELGQMRLIDSLQRSVEILEHQLAEHGDAASNA